MSGAICHTLDFAVHQDIGEKNLNCLYNREGSHYPLTKNERAKQICISVHMYSGRMHNTILLEVALLQGTLHHR